MRIRSMSAGRSGASVYNANVNGDQGGGDAKQGLAPTTNKRVQFVLRAIQRRAYATPEQRSKVFCINQLGGIGRPSKMFATTADGVNKAACLAMQTSSLPKGVNATGFLNDLYMLLFGRGVDSSGKQTYSEYLYGNLPNTLPLGPSGAVATNFVIKLLEEQYGIPKNEHYMVIVVLIVQNSPEARSSSYSPTDSAIQSFYDKCFTQGAVKLFNEG